MKHLLLIEDDPDIRETMELVLLSQGFRVTGVPHGRAAFAACQGGAGRPQAILLDLMMPVMDGWEFLSRQADDPMLAGVPVIIVSAQPIKRELPPQVVAVMTKPVTMNALLDAIEHARRAQVVAA